MMSAFGFGHKPRPGYGCFIQLAAATASGNVRYPFFRINLSLINRHGTLVIMNMSVENEIYPIGFIQRSKLRGVRVTGNGLLFDQVIVSRGDINWMVMECYFPLYIR